MTLFGRSTKGGGCCGSGSLVPVNETSTEGKKEEAKPSNKCCNTCC